MSELQSYEPIRKLADNLWVVDGDFYDTAFRRRMTIVRLPGGDLVLHSAIQMREADIEELEKLGHIAYIVVPNAFHDSDAPYYAEKFPEAKVYVPARSRKKFAKRSRVTGTIEDDWPLRDALPAITARGNLAGENVFVHRESRTAIFCDFVFNMDASAFKRKFELKLMRWNGVVEQCGPSWLTKNVFARDRKAVAEFRKALAAFDFDRVIMNHGRIVETGGKQRVLDGYARVYGPL